MKKLTLLLALMLVVTIGGVYATWSYAGTNDIADSYAETKVTITDAVLTGANGTYAIESNLVLLVDQKNDDHEAELIFASNNNEAVFLKVTFTPSSSASQDIKNEAVPSQLYFGTTTAMEYKMDNEGNYADNGAATKILKFANESDNKLDIAWTKEGDIFTYTMDEAALKAQIQLNKNFVLDIKSEHAAFREALNGNIIAHVTDGNVTP